MKNMFQKFQIKSFIPQNYKIVCDKYFQISKKLPMVAQQFATMKNRCSIFYNHIVVYGWTCTFQDVVKKIMLLTSSM